VLPKVITFDCYGTLVRWPETLRAVFDSLLPSGADGAKFHKDFGEFHMQIKKGPYRPYSQVLRLTLEKTMQKWRLADIAPAQEQLLASIHAIDPYPEVVPVLHSLAVRCRLAIISNTEDALIGQTVRGLEAPFAVITAEQARAYKPDHRLFDYAHERLGVSREDVVHVGAGLVTDMVPAFELGLARVWINRRGEQCNPAMPPTAELPDLSALEATVASIVRSGRK
jgi:2-haloacid dehalogenase